MKIVCLDLEGVLVPEIWITFSERTGIPELRRTTRDEPDYDKLMKWRLGVLREHGLGLKEIQETIARIDPLRAIEGQLGGPQLAAVGASVGDVPSSDDVALDVPGAGGAGTASRRWRGPRLRGKARRPRPQR